MDYYCDICDKTINIKSKRKHLQTLAHIELSKSIRTRYPKSCLL